MTDARRTLAEQIAGEITLSGDPGATLRKWRTDFDVSQTTLADHLDVSSSVIDNLREWTARESGYRRRSSHRHGTALTSTKHRGGDRIRQYARVLSAGFDSSIVNDLREYSTSIPLADFYDAIDATELAQGTSAGITGHTVIDSIEAFPASPARNSIDSSARARTVRSSSRTSRGVNRPGRDARRHPRNASPPRHRPGRILGERAEDGPTGRGFARNNGMEKETMLDAIRELAP